MTTNQPRSGDILPAPGFSRGNGIRTKEKRRRRESFRAYGAFVGLVGRIPPAKAGGWQNVAATRLKTAVAVLLLTLFSLLAFAQSTPVDVSGAWAVTIEAPRGDVDFRMWIVQKGSKLTGYMLSEVGQFDMEGSITSNQIKFSWSFPDGGQMVAISCQGKVEGRFISGTAKVGNFEDRPMSAERR